MSFIVKQQHFEGPLDLLLSLIEKRKLFINDIALAKVTDDFISHIQSLNQFPMADSANFILIASTLLLIKSKSLLPINSAGLRTPMNSATARLAHMNRPALSLK